jgi:hypothetical protein
MIRARASRLAVKLYRFGKEYRSISSDPALNAFPRLSKVWSAWSEGRSEAVNFDFPLDLLGGRAGRRPMKLKENRSLPLPSGVAVKGRRPTPVTIDDVSQERASSWPSSRSEAERASFFENLVGNTIDTREQSERRRAKRYPLKVVAMATPLDEQFRPVGAPFPVLTRDISSQRIGLVHSRPLDMKYVDLDLTGPQGRRLKMTVEVLRCNRFLCGNTEAEQLAADDACTYFESGGEIVSRPGEEDDLYGS